jgi:hypothetical protein
MKHDAIKRSTSELLLFIPNVIGHQARWLIGKIRMRLAASGALVAVNRELSAHGNFLRNCSTSRYDHCFRHMFAVHSIYTVWAIPCDIESTL